MMVLKTIRNGFLFVFDFVFEIKKRLHNKQILVSLPGTETLQYVNVGDEVSICNICDTPRQYATINIQFATINIQMSLLFMYLYLTHS